MSLSIEIKTQEKIQVIEVEKSSDKDTAFHTLQECEEDKDDSINSELSSIKMSRETFLCNWKLNMTVESDLEAELRLMIPGFFEKNGEVSNRSALRRSKMSSGDTSHSGTCTPSSLCTPLEGSSRTYRFNLTFKLRAISASLTSNFISSNLK